MGKTKYIDAERIIVALRIMEKAHKEKAHDDLFEAVYAGAIAGIANAIDKLPAADVAEVCRCKDCKYQDKGENDCEAWNLCGYRPWLHIPTEDDAFCSKGERKDG